MSAEAGANQETAGHSFDGLETTSWSNDGSLATAWIDYELASPASPTLIDVKLNAFRTRRYPVKITLDGRVVFEGTTPLNLGYATIPLRQTGAGTHLRIAMTGPPIDKLQAAGTAEITGKYDGAGVAPVTRDSKAALNIIEVDVYR